MKKSTQSETPRRQQLQSQTTGHKTNGRRKSKATSSPKQSGREKEPSSKVAESHRIDLRDRKAEARRRVGITDEMMAGVPQISHILNEAEGGLPRVIDALSGYDEEDAQKFIEKYNTVSVSDRERLSLEEISIAAGVPTLDLLAAATKALFMESQTISGIIASTSHPKVVRKTIEMALQPGGHKDRQMLHNAQGFLPIPKGSIFISNRVQVANFNEDAGGAPTPEAVDAADLPGMDDDIRGLDDFERKMLEAHKP